MLLRPYTLAPLAWLMLVTVTGAYQKVFSPDPRLGFLAQAARLQAQMAAADFPAERIASTGRLIFNNQLDAFVTLLFVGLILVLLAEALWRWWQMLRGTRPTDLHETPHVPTQWSEAA